MELSWFSLDTEIRNVRAVNQENDSQAWEAERRFVGFCITQISSAYVLGNAYMIRIREFQDHATFREKNVTTSYTD